MRNLIRHREHGPIVYQWCSLILVYCAFCPVVMPQASAPAQASSAVTVLGAFSHIMHTEEDAFGYALNLWKEGNQVFGLIYFYTGPPADPPTGILEDVEFDPRTKHFSFSARLSTGLVYSREYAGVPSQDRLTFKGVLQRRQVVGNLAESDDLFPDRWPTSKRVTLRWSKLLTDDMNPPPASYSAWKTWADKILRRRGLGANQTPQATFNCEVTKPNGIAAGVKEPAPGSYGNQDVSVGPFGLWPEGTIVFKPDGAGFITRRGALGMKLGWLRGVSGKLRITGRRLDADAPPLRSEVPDGYGDRGFQATYLIFPTPGCWEVTGTVGDSSVTFVTKVVKIGKGPPWHRNVP